MRVVEFHLQVVVTAISDEFCDGEENVGQVTKHFTDSGIEWFSFPYAGQSWLHVQGTFNVSRGGGGELAIGEHEGVGDE